MDLFDFDHKPEDTKLGFRLVRLEVYNWGTFDEKIWSLDVDGETALLTGDVGSGKSTLVDALITLLVPPKKVTYNKAADASARERNLVSYVRGYYGQKRTQDGVGQPEALRDKNQYSVIVGVFSDANLGVRVSLAQVFWFKDEGSWPARFYCLADKTLSIENHFTNFGSDIKNLRKRLMGDQYIHVYDEYTQYSKDFRRRFGIRSSQALDLFQQTISMKKVDGLTGFVRQSMLERPDTEADIQILLGHFHDLDEAHSAVVRAKEQQRLLTPLVEMGDAYFEDYSRGINLDLMEKYLPLWAAEKDMSLRVKEEAALSESLEAINADIAAIRSQQADTEAELDRLSRQLYQEGGHQIDILEKELDAARERLEVHQQAADDYYGRLRGLKLDFPSDEAEYKALQEAISQRLEEEQIREQRLVTARLDADSLLKQLERSETETRAELESLKNRKSSIPSEFIAIRKELCQSLDVAEHELPFAGELMQVKETESEWEGALERLLHGFALSLLVSRAHYGQIIHWMNTHSIKQRMVYYAVDDLTQQASLDNMPEEAACCKLDIREDSKFSGWLKSELKKRFAHRCCDTVDEFKRASYALSAEGQIKQNGQRHEKDDRYSIDDRRRYVLGFSNHKKIHAIQLELEELEENVKEAQKEIGSVKYQQKQCSQLQNACSLLLENKSFQSIDTGSIKSDIESKEKILAGIKQDNNQYRELELKKNELSKRKESLAERYDQLKDARTRADERLKGHRYRIQEDKRRLAEADADKMVLVMPRIEEYARYVAKDESLRLDSLQRLTAELQRLINQEKSVVADSREQKGRKLAELMQSFRISFPELGNDLGSEPASLEEYRRILQRLELDDLPRFEDRFRALLRESTINQIALFQEKLENLREEIKDRISLINKSLAAIDYNDGRYIQIECDEVADSDIKSFRSQLRQCTDSALLSEDDGHYSEEQFNQVEAIIARFRGRPDSAEADERWKQRVTDVRNWFSFAASERWRETDEEYEHYTDSGGKSGGQKEKLAYTILAASLVYNFGLERKDKTIQSFRFVVIDEAFLKSSDESARFGLELFKKLDLQLLVVTPLAKIGTIEPYVSHVGFVYQDDQQHRSYLRNLSIRQLSKEREQYEGV